MINLVTVTFLRDLRQMLLQAESVQKYVSPCTHYVIVANCRVTNSQKQRWHKLLRPFYTRHKLVLIFPDMSTLPEKHVRNNSNYWYCFLFQFTIAEILDDDYMVLNSKNFFVKPTLLEEFRGRSGNTSIAHKSTQRYDWINGMNAFCRYLKIIPQSYVLQSHTPAMINRKLLISKLGNFVDFKNQWLQWTEQTSIDFSVSDWIFYGLLMGQEEIKKQSKMKHIYSGFWPLAYKDKCDKFLEDLDYLLKDKQIPITGIHRDVINSLNTAQLTQLNYILKKHGFTIKVKRTSKQYLG